MVCLGLGPALWFFLFEVVDKGVDELVVGGLEAFALDPLFLLEAVFDGFFVRGKGPDVESFFFVLAHSGRLDPLATYF